jgi:AcrR family transcriptional regulator
MAVLHSETVPFHYRTIPYDFSVTQTEDRIDPRIVDSRLRVLTAALEELAEVGYGAFAIESVCRRSGVAKSTLYRHWPGKPALVADALRSLNVQPGSPQATRSDVERPPKERVVEIIHHLVTAFAGSVVGDCTPALVDAAERDSELRDLFHAYTAERRRTLVDAIAAGVGSRDFPAGLDPELAAVALAGAVMYRRLMTPSPMRPGEVEALIATVLG